MARLVLDTYAVFSFLGLNPGERETRVILERAQDDVHTLFMSQINLGELAYHLERLHSRSKAMNVLSGIVDLPIRREAATWSRILAAAHIKAQYLLSYADAFAVSLARELEAGVVTGDPEFASVEALVPIVWLPGK